MANEKIINLDVDLFDATINGSDIPVLVHFAHFSTSRNTLYSMPYMALDEVLHEYEGKVAFYRLEFGRSIESVELYIAFSSHPIVLFINGEVVGKTEQIVSTNSLKEFINSHI